MIQLLIEKEIRQGLTSLRYILTLALTLGIFSTAAVFHVKSFNTRRADFDRANLNRMEQLKKNAEHLNALAQGEQSLLREPRHTELLASGSENRLPDRITFSAFYYAGYENIDRLNYRLKPLYELDWVFIVGLVLSFAALVLTFDRISGEKEGGTLRLQCSNAVSRFTIFISKYLASLCLMALVLAAGMLASLIIVSIGTHVFLPGLYPPEILIAFVLFLVYLSFFLLLGLFLSSRVHTSSSSLAIALLLWTFFIFIIPGGGSMLGQKIRKIQSSYEYWQKRRAAWDDIWTNAPEPKARGYWNGRDFPFLAERVKLVNRLGESDDRFREDRILELLGQVRFSRTLTLVSPYSLLRFAMESVAGTGLEAFVRFYMQGKLHRGLFRDFVTTRDAGDPDSYHRICLWHPEAYSGKPVPPEDIPVFTERKVPALPALIQARLPLLVLFLLNLLAATLAFVSFIRYDIR